MTYEQMFALISELKMSPEAAASILGVSGMTLRRWRAKPPQEALPKLYERAFAEGVEQMIVDGCLSPDSKGAQAVMEKSAALSFQARLKLLGFDRAPFTPESDITELVKGLAEIATTDRIAAVNASEPRLDRFKAMGEHWNERIGCLLSNIKSPILAMSEKLIAYGALFYLLTPFDLIPDTIPVLGLLDDYSVLGLAVAYYKNTPPIAK